MEKCEYHKRVLEYIFGLLKVQKSDITPEINQKVEKAEKYIQSILRPRNVSSSHHQEEDSANVQSRQQFVPSHLTISDQPLENIQVSIQQGIYRLPFWFLFLSLFLVSTQFIAGRKGSLD